MRTKHKHYDVIVAWANGEEIQYEHKGSWIDINDPDWYETVNYRIKPKRVKKEGWVNVYKGSLLTVHTVKDCADQARIIGKEKITCIRITWEEEV